MVPPMNVESESRPNFIILLADDLGYGDLSGFGHPTIRTPNLDRLANQGLKLTSCYAGAPVCSPSRAALLTGRVPQREGIAEWIPDNSAVHLRRGSPTIASLLRSDGYATAMFGKWHLSGRLDGSQPTPGDHGFDYWFATQNNALPTHENPVNFVRNGQAVGPLKGYSSTLIVDETIGWLRNRKNEKPFFLYLPFHSPHERVATDDRYVRRHASLGNPDKAQYFGNVEQLDDEIGRLLRTLDELKLSRNTFIVFTSDNGPETLNRYRNADRSYGSPGRHRGMKLHLYEGGIRVPGIIRWPAGMRAKGVSDEPVRSTDLLPTICELAGVPVPEGREIDGQSLVPLLKGGQFRRRDPLYWQYDHAPTAGRNALPEPKTALREGDWKLLAQAGLEKFSLYNLRNDPEETSDLSNREPAIRDRMTESLKRVHGEINNGSQGRFNIISIVTDDQSHWSIGAYGNRESRTPNMDRLARDGALFTNAFATTPVCSPSRVGFMTGLYGTQAGVTEWISPREGNEGLGMTVAAPTWPQILQQNGWRTALFGKWHLGNRPQFHPTRRGYDYFYGFLDGGNQPVDPTLEVDGRNVKLQGPLPDLLTSDALRFISANSDRPFAVSLHYRAPHLPYGPVPEVDSAHFKNLDPTIPQLKGLDVAQVKQWYRDYYASVHSVDRNIGRLLDELERLGIADRTIVLFTSDHGYNIGQHLIHTKGNGYWIAGGVAGPKRPNMFDTSLRIPLIVKWPGVTRPGTVIPEMVTNLDTFASVLGMLRIESNASQNGRDFSSLLRGEKPDWRDTLFGQYDLHNGGLAFMRMIRTGDWKLVRHYHSDQMDELYDLKNDPDETHNVWDLPAYADVRAALTQQLVQEMLEQVDKSPHARSRA